MRRNNYCGIFILLVISALPVTLPAAPGKLIEEPVTEEGPVVYSYEMEPYVSINTNKPGFLIELALEILRPVRPRIAADVSKVRGLIKYSLLYEGGIAAVGTGDDFTEAERTELQSIALYENGDVQYLLYLNMSRPRAEELYNGARMNLEELRRDGTVDRLLEKYNISGGDR